MVEYWKKVRGECKTDDFILTRWPMILFWIHLSPFTKPPYQYSEARCRPSVHEINTPVLINVS